MRLLIKTILYFAIASLLFFIVAGFIIVYDFNNIINQDIDKYLINREEIATTQLVNDISLESLNNYEQIIAETESTKHLDKMVFKDTTRYDVIDDAFHAYRMLRVTRRIGNHYYDITVFRSLIQPNILIKEVLVSLFIVFLGLLAFLILSNLLISRRIWLPFKDTLETLEQYELGSAQAVNLRPTTTREFNQLNSIIEGMIKKIQTDYLNLKEFTQHVAHETQTPLAIIRSKSEKLLQSENLTQEQYAKLSVIYNNCIRLSKVNRGLTLLTKIESGAYHKEKQVNVTKILKAQVQHFDEKISLKNISLETELSHEIRHDINPELAIVLISNLIRNAIGHNVKGGRISISTFEGGMLIQNTGGGGEIDANLFKRFKKSTDNSLGMGLGLSLITKICELYHITLQYEHLKGIHLFRLSF